MTTRITKVDRQFGALIVDGDNFVWEHGEAQTAPPEMLAIVQRFVAEAKAYNRRAAASSEEGTNR